MNDEQLEQYIRRLSKTKNIDCIKCKKPRANFTINIQNKEAYQQKKICSICDDCYKELLDYLGTIDAIWD